jgi:hypothetical protein
MAHALHVARVSPALGSLVSNRKGSKSTFEGMFIQAESKDLRDVHCTLSSNNAQ